MTTDNIEVPVAGEGWLSVIDEEITFELLALEGVEAVFGTAELPAGKYTQVRLSVPEVQIEKDGELITAEVPSSLTDRQRSSVSISRWTNHWWTDSDRVSCSNRLSSRLLASPVKEV